MVLPENALHSFPKGCAWTRQNGCRTRIRPQRAMPQPTHRCRVQLFFFFLFPMHTKPGWLAPNQSVSAAETDWFGLNRPIQVKIPKKKKKVQNAPFCRNLQVLSLHRVISWYAFMLLLFCLSFFFWVNWVLFEFLLLYMWKNFVLYTVEFWVSWNLRESFLNWVGDINYVTCIGVKLCNGSGVVCTFTALICSLWNLKVYLNFSLVWKLLTWGNDTNKRPFWLWYAWLIFCQIDFFCFLSKVEESRVKMRIWGGGGVKLYEISFVYCFSCCCYLFTYGCQFYVKMYA